MLPEESSLAMPIRNGLRSLRAQVHRLGLFFFFEPPQVVCIHLTQFCCPASTWEQGWVQVRKITVGDGFFFFVHPVYVMDQSIDQMCWYLLC